MLDLISYLPEEKLNEPRIPRRIYKYRAFSGRVLDMLVADQLYFSDPADFNDPLDSRPNVEGDITDHELEQILSHLVEQRIKAEMTTAAKSLKYRGPKPIDHIARHSRKRADSLLNEIRYNAGNPAYEMDDPEHFLLTQYLEEELLRVLLQILDMAEKEPFRICGQKASARVWNCSASDGLGL